MAALKELFPTASMEVIALRLLDLDQPCVVSVLDDGVVASERHRHCCRVQFPQSRRSLDISQEECDYSAR